MDDEGHALVHHTGPDALVAAYGDALVAAYGDVLEGRARPDQGHIMRLV